MKKLLIFLSLSALIACVACGKDDLSSGAGQEDVVIPSKDPVNETLSPEEQGERLSAVTNELIDKVNVNDLIPASQAFHDLESIDWYEYENGLDEIDRTHKLYESIVSITQNNDGVETCIYKLKEACGHYTLKNNGRIDYESASDFELKVNGYTLKATFSENSNRVIVFRKGWYEGYGRYSYYEEGIDLPESTQISLLKGGEELMKIVFNARPQIHRSLDEFNFTGDSFDVDCILKVGPYEYRITKADYADFNATFNSGFLKGGEALFARNMGMKNLLFYEGTLAGCKEANFNIDLLGMVQVKGNLKNGEAIFDADFNTYDKASVDDFVKIVNENLDAALYFSSDVKQARLVLKSVSYSDYYGKVYEPKPFILMNDQSYSLDSIQEIFSSNQLELLMNKADNLRDSFFRLF